MNSWSSNYNVDNSGTVSESTKGLWEHIKVSGLSLHTTRHQYWFLLPCTFHADLQAFLLCSVGDFRCGKEVCNILTCICLIFMCKKFS